jgi:hypothetical protein
MFKRQLFKLCGNPVNKTRGFHVCSFCGGPWWAPPDACLDGVKCFLGNGEVHVVGREVCYAAPTLIYHYVVDHGYCPPEDFVEAVLRTRDVQDI